jgi:hypothetical protein
MTMLDGLCDCCGKNEPVGVASSAIVAMSFAFCKQCLEDGIEPYAALVGACLGPGPYVDALEDLLTRSLAVHGKTREQLIFDSEKLMVAYDEEMRKQYGDSP